MPWKSSSDSSRPGCLCILNTQGEYGAAWDELALAEEAFSICDQSLTGGIDNVGMLLLDIVW